MDSQYSIRYVHLIKNGNDEYVFVRNIGTGVQSSAQLVLDRQTGEYLVRKARASKLKQSPKIIEFFSGGFAPNHLRLPSDPPMYSQVTFSPLYNGGSLDVAYTKCRDSQVAFPSGLVLQFIEHIAGALQFMYTVCKPPILHTDVHDGNCFLRVDTATFKPSFFLADFGYTVRQPRDTVAPDVYGLWEIAARLSRLPPHSRNNTDDAALDRVMKKLKDLADTSGGVGIPSHPDLSEVLRLVSETPRRSPTREELRLLFAHVLLQTDVLRPASYNSREACLEARNVRGPWYWAKVRVDSESGAIMDVLLGQVSKRTHYRPNQNNNDSDTDNDVGENMVLFDISDSDFGVESWDSENLEELSSS